MTCRVHLNQAIINAVGEAGAANVTTEMLRVDGKDLCRVHVQPSKFPIDPTVTYDKKGEREKRTEFFYRFGNQSKAIKDTAEIDKVKQQVWSLMRLASRAGSRSLMVVCV